MTLEMRLWLVALLALLALAVVAMPVQAAPNGLTQVPLAPVYPAGDAVLGLTRARQGTTSTVYDLQFGVGDRGEVGIDYQAAPSVESFAAFKAKLLLMHKPERFPEVSLGIQNIASGQKAVPYLVATTQTGATGITLGSIRSGSGYQGMWGLTYHLSPFVQAVIDRIGGPSGHGTLGLIWTLSPELSVNLAYSHPNHSESGPRGFVANIAYVLRLKSR